MKKLLLIVLITLVAFSSTGCSNTNELEIQVTALQTENSELTAENAKLVAENTKLNEEISGYKEKEESEKQEQAKIEAEKSKYKQVKFDEQVIVDGYGEFVIKSAELKQKVMPPNPSSFYTYYEVKDPNEIYLDVVIDFKNTTTISIGADEVTSIKVIYDNGYEYSSFSALEESGGGDFTYTNINKVEPLKSIRLHYLSTLPIEAKDSGKPIKIQFTVYGSNFELNIR